MDWTSKIDQQRSALFLTFFMFISMVLVLVRYGLSDRSAAILFAQPKGAPNLAGAEPQDGAEAGCGPPHPHSFDEIDRTYLASLILLHMAREAARAMLSLRSTIYELMKLADQYAGSLRSDCCAPSKRLHLLGERLDAP